MPADPFRGPILTFVRVRRRLRGTAGVMRTGAMHGPCSDYGLGMLDGRRTCTSRAVCFATALN